MDTDSHKIKEFISNEIKLKRPDLLNDGNVNFLTNYANKEITEDNKIMHWIDGDNQDIIVFDFTDL